MINNELRKSLDYVIIHIQECKDGHYSETDHDLIFNKFDGYVFALGNAIKYISRYCYYLNKGDYDKATVKDLCKASHYILTQIGEEDVISCKKNIEFCENVFNTEWSGFGSPEELKYLTLSNAMENIKIAKYGIRNKLNTNNIQIWLVFALRSILLEIHKRT